MNFKSFWNNSDLAFVLKMILIALAIVVVMGAVALWWLDKYTSVQPPAVIDTR